MEYKSFDQLSPEELGYKTCIKCGRQMQDNNFYTARLKELYPPDGKINICKKCFTMHIDNYNPETIKPLLEQLDIPFVEYEWNRLMEPEKEKDPFKTRTSPGIFGRYVSYMKLEQWRGYGYKDSDMLNEMVKQKQMEINIKEIELAEEKEKEKKKQETIEIESITPEILKNLSDEDIALLFPDLEEKPQEIRKEVDALDFDKGELTLEDKQYLALKWGKLYKIDEWIKLEQFYNEMLQSFDIQTASHYDYLKKICKTSLKMEQALDVGDIEGFQKLSKVYDSLMKSANFTAIQNKEDANFFVSSIGEMVALCEEKGFITKFHTDEPKDIVDFTMRDMENFYYKLVKNELGLGNMIEIALNKMLQLQQEDSNATDVTDEEEVMVNAEELFEDVLEELNFDEEGGDIEDGIEGYLRTRERNQEI